MCSADHPRAADVDARLVELDPVLRGARPADRGDLAGGDRGGHGRRRGFTDAYAGAVPAQLALFCGVFGNISDTDIAATVAAAPEFVRPGGVVVWTRHREDPDLVPRILEWFAAAGFEPLFVSPKEAGFGVGAHRYAGAGRPLVTGRRLFTFQR